jgi:hypothetical protein
VKRFLGVTVVVVLLLFGIGSMVFGVFDFIRLVNHKVTRAPTTGAYHEPVVTALTVGSGVAGVLLTIGLMAAATRVEDSTTAKVITGASPCRY